MRYKFLERKLTFLFLILFASCNFSFDDHFTGTQILDFSKIHSLQPVYKLDYKDGYIEIYNREEPLFPIILFKEKNEIVWAIEMTTMENTFFSKIENPRIITRFALDDKIEFIGYWTFGAERGYAYFNKTRFKEFYLSW